VKISKSVYDSLKKSQPVQSEKVPDAAVDVQKTEAGNDIHRTTKSVKCDVNRSPLNYWSLRYWENSTDAKQYGCKITELLDWALSLRTKEKNYFSQNGEDGVLAEIFLKIEEKSRFFVEFGVQDASVCNTRYFR
jgi:hypothetical protein